MHGQRTRKTTAHISALQFGELTSIEMLTAVLCYIPVARSADRVGKKPFVVITFINFACFPLVLYFCHSFGALILAFIVRGLKEFGEPTRKALIMHLAPENERPRLSAHTICAATPSFACPRSPAHFYGGREQKRIS